MPEPSRPESSHDPLIFDRLLLRARRRRAVAAGAETFLLDRVASEVKRIPKELAEAREAIWTPDKEKAPADTKLWTPGS